MFTIEKEWFGCNKVALNTYTNIKGVDLDRIKSVLCGAMSDHAEGSIKYVKLIGESGEFRGIAIKAVYVINLDAIGVRLPQGVQFNIVIDKTTEKSVRRFIAAFNNCSVDYVKNLSELFEAIKQYM